MFENKKNFSPDISRRELEWKKTVKTKQINNTGIIEIEIYAASRMEAERTAQAVAWALSVRGHKYHGGGDWVKIVTIDGPSTSTAPAKPNLWLNTLFGFLVGLVGAGSILYFMEDLNLVIFKKKKRGLVPVEQPSLKKESVVFETGKEEKPIFLREGSLSGEMLKRALNYSSEEDYRPFIKKSDFVLPQEEPIKESVRVITPGETESDLSGKKAPAPDNLPIFEGLPEQKDKIAAEKVYNDNRKPEALEIDEEGFVSLEKLKSAVQNQNAVGGGETSEEEPSEEEVRNRLNKLLKGDL